jgi:RHS repeat-associated protein
MKSFRNIIFFCTIFLMMSFLDNKPVYAVECPSGYTYNASANRCEAEPPCPGGWYDPAKDQCTATADFPCSSGEYTFNEDAFRCEANPLCPDGWYEDAYNSCVAEAVFTCNSSAFTFNYETYRCEAEPTCCSSASFVPAVPPSHAAYCDEGHHQPCSCAGYGGMDENGYGVCRGTVDCHGGIPVDLSMKCISTDLTITCPAGYYYWSYYRICNKAAGCPDGGSFQASIDLCTIPVTKTCPSGYTYNSTLKNCYKSPPQCPNGGHFSGGTIDKCIATPYPEPNDDDCDKGNQKEGQCCIGRIGQPISVGNGKVVAAETDFTISGIIPLSFKRYYSSTETLVKSLGWKWGQSFDTKVTSLSYNLYKVTNANGAIVYYNDTDHDNVYEADIPKGERSSLIKNAGNTFTRVFQDGTSEEFNTAGYLTSVVDRNGNRMILTRDTGNKLTKITDPSNREINITYNASNLISQIALPDGKTIGYTYIRGMPQKVTYPDGTYRTYEYSGYNLTGVKDENGNYIEKHTYDAQGRGTTSSADGTNEKLTISYLSDSQSTVTNSLGRVTTYTIDKTGGKSHVTSIAGPGCKSCGNGDTSYTYDEDLNVTSRTDANGNVTMMTYDTDGNMVTKTEAYGTSQERTTTYTYNEYGEVLTETDNDGIITTYTYDTAGNILEKTEAYGTADERTTTYTYNAYGQLLTVTDLNGNTTTNTYDQYGNLASVTNELNQTITYTYDLMGKLLSMTDANGKITTYEYDLRYRLIRETRPDTGVINYEYDDAGNKTAVVDANGNRTTLTYDAVNRLIKTADAEGSSVNQTYSTENNVTSMNIKDSAQNIKTSETYTYDDHNRLTRTTHADSTYTEQIYDDLGNVLTKRDEKGNVTTYAYDALNRLQSVKDPMAGTTSYTYDSRNNLTSITDANGRVTTYTYDSVNRLISTASPDTGTTTYTYDDNGNMLTKTDANGITSTFTYDALNRQTEIQFPDLTQNINYYYDDPPSENGKGRLTAMSDPSGTTWYDYDTMGRIITETHQVDGINYQTGYTYDLNGNTISIIYPSGRKITYAYNQLNKITSITDTYLGVTRTLAENIIYAPFGDILSMVTGNRISTAKTYDNRSRLNGLNIDSFKQLTYIRDNMGNITAITDAINPSSNKSYTYDNLYFLTVAVGQWGSLNYTYDRVGNRQTETTGTGATSYSYTANKLTSVSGEKVFSFGYDNNGNATTDNSKRYIYNQNQRLTQVTDTGNVLVEYVYNAKGQRVKKTPSGQTTIFHYDQQGLLIAESESSGTITTEYVYLNGQPLAKINSIFWGVGYNSPEASYPLFKASSSVKIDLSSPGAGWLRYYYTRRRLNFASTLITGFSMTENTITVGGTGKVNGVPDFTFTATIIEGSPDAMGIEIYNPNGTLYYSASPQPLGGGNYNTGSSVFFYHNDHLGTPMMMTDSAGTVVWQGEYLPFGEPYSVTGLITNNLRFPGQYYDTETGLNYNWHRDYEPRLGRYIEADPILKPMIIKTMKSSCDKSTLTWRVPILISKPQDLYPYVYTKANPINLLDPTGLVCGSGWTDDIVPDSYGNFDFTMPCKNHDTCFETCGKSQLGCAATFYSDMMRECSKLTWNPISQLSCVETAILYATVVASPVGYPAYYKAQRKACCKN